MKSIMLSIRPEWVEKILNGNKTIEIRKTIPKCDLPAKVYIYCTNNGNLLRESIYPNGVPEKRDFYLADRGRNDNRNLNGKVVAEFMLNEITDLRKMHHLKSTGLILYKGAMDMAQYNKYGGRYAWHISDLKIYDKPKGLSEFFYAFSKDKDDAKFSIRGKCLERQKWGVCDYTTRLTRPPQSWCYVEEFGGDDE